MRQALFTSYRFNYPLVLACMQLLATGLVTYVVGRPPLHRSTAAAVFPLALINAGNCMFGLIGQPRGPIP